jgi:hypothetical protein
MWPTFLDDVPAAESREAESRGARILKLDLSPFMNSYRLEDDPDDEPYDDEDDDFDDDEDEDDGDDEDEEVETWQVGHFR